MSLKSILMNTSCIRSWVHLWRDTRESITRHLKPITKRDSRYGLTPIQRYPLGEDFHQVMIETASVTLAGTSFDKETPVAAIGSCFAEEVSRVLRENAFNFLIEEKNLWNFSAAWGRVFTVPNFCQIVDYSLNPNLPIVVGKSSHGYFDATRDSEAFFKTVAEAEKAISAHREKSLLVFQNAKVLFFTLGQNEAWIDQQNNVVWGKMPPAEYLEEDKERFRVERFSIEKNKQLLSAAIDQLFQLNPELRIVLTISPVSSSAAFLSDEVIASSFANKCTLRVVADEIVLAYKGRVGYFPSFEMVLAYNPSTLKADNRHVKYGTVNRIFDTLQQASKKPVKN